jgi:hypothetical protein
MPACPHCRREIRIAELPHPSWLENYRICPNCGGYFTVDNKTKRRQAVALGLAAISLVLTLLLYFQGIGWLFPALVSYLALAVLIYWGNKEVRFVPYEKAVDDA